MTDNTWPTVDTELIDDVTLYSAKLIIPVTGPVIIDGAVAIHGDRVVHVGKRRWVLKALKQEMEYNAIVACEGMEDWEQAKERLAKYTDKYPKDEEAKKEAEFLETR